MYYALGCGQSRQHLLDRVVSSKDPLTGGYHKVHCICVPTGCHKMLLCRLIVVLLDGSQLCANVPCFTEQKGYSTALEKCASSFTDL